MSLIVIRITTSINVLNPPCMMNIISFEDGRMFGFILTIPNMTETLTSLQNLTTNYPYNNVDTLLRSSASYIETTKSGRDFSDTYPSVTRADSVTICFYFIE